MLTPDLLSELFLNGMTPADPYGRPASAGLLSSAVKAAAATLERRFNIAVTERVVTLGEPQVVLPPDLSTEPHDAVPHDPRDNDGDRYVWIQLPTRPVRQVLSLQLRLPGMATPTAWPEHWIQLNREGAYIQVFPMGTGLTGPTFGLSGLAISTLSAYRSVPNAWHVAYTAGYTEAELQGKHADLLRAWGMLAAVGVLIPGSIDRYMMSGISGLSASVDGLSNSTQLMQNSGALKFAPLVQAYKAELAEWDRIFSQKMRGLVIGYI